MEVKYRSTRGGVSGVSFQEALLSGFAPDGGLFVPDSLPSFSLEDLKSWANLTYPQLIEKFTRFFISQNEIADQEIPGKFLACSHVLIMSPVAIYFSVVMR
jgi:threonine synthase